MRYSETTAEAFAILTFRGNVFVGDFVCTVFLKSCRYCCVFSGLCAGIRATGAADNPHFCLSGAAAAKLRHSASRRDQVVLPPSGMKCTLGSRAGRQVASPGAITIDGGHFGL